MSSGRILDEKPFLSGVLFFFFLTIHRGKSIILQKARFEHTESESWEYEKTISKKKLQTERWFLFEGSLRRQKALQLTYMIRYKLTITDITL